MRARMVLAVLVGIAVVSASFGAQAHFTLTMPPPADTATDGGKGAPPCGPTTASNVVTPAQGGHPITIALDETVMHPGWYRIALSINSRTELPADPMVTVSGGNSTNASFQNPAVFPVLVDHVFVHTSGTAPLHYSMSVTLPNITCAKCTLQVIEFMNMHASNPGGGYFYHHCADLMITADPNLPDAGVTDAGSTTGTGGRGAGGGRGGAGGSAAGTGGRGGVAGATAGAGGTAGSTTGTGGATGAAGASGGTGGTTGGAGASGGTPGTGGAAGTTGTTGAGGTTGVAGKTGAAGSSGDAPASPGCGCTLSGGAENAGAIGCLFVLATLLRRRRRR